MVFCKFGERIGIMKPIQTPIADFILSYYINNAGTSLNAAQDDAVRAYIESLIAGTSSNGVEQTIATTSPALFDLKVALLPAIPEDHIVVSEPGQHYALPADAFSGSNDLLLILDTISTPAAATAGFGTLSADTFPNTYQALMSLLALVPKKLSSNLTDFLNLVLEIDCALIIHRLVRHKRIPLPDSEQKNLVHLLKQKSEALTIFALKNGLLPVSGKDLCQLHRNAKIRLAAEELKENKGRFVSSDELKTLLSA